MVWFVAGVAAAIWCGILALLAVGNEPRRVAPGPATLEPAGDEPPAVVGLVAGDWEPHRDAVTATVLDLAARRYVAIEWLAPHTFVRVRERGPDVALLAPYERQVLDHLRTLSRETTDGMVPTQALTTGPEREAAAWRKQFSRAVVADARARGLSRPRWSRGARAVLGAWALVVGLTVGIAATTLPHDETDDDPVGVAVALAVVTAGGLVVVAGRLAGERDTEAGRVVAARWLGLRRALADDPTFPVQPPAAVAVWGRLMGYAAAMGLTGAASDALPLGAESERRAWSPVGNRWRPVTIRYPDVLPPGYGRSPTLATVVGILAAGVGLVVAPTALAIGDALLDTAGDAATSGTVPWWARLAVGIVIGFVLAGGVLVALGGAWLLVAGVADLVRPRRVVEGRVLRIRERGDDDHRYWHVAVDDGTRDRVRAWRVDSRPAVAQGDTVRASVSRWLAHVRDLTELVPATTESAVVEPSETVDTGLGAPLPDAAAVATAVGTGVHAVPDAPVHPLAVGGASATYTTDAGGHLMAAWIAPATFAALRALPRAEAPAVPGVGDEAYRAPMGGGLLVRVGDRVLMAAASLPGDPRSSGDAGGGVDHDRVVDALARACVVASGT